MILTLCLISYSEASKAKWTVMVYIAGDNNLDSALLQDINEMEAVGSEEGVFNVIVLFDRWTGEWVYGQEGITKTNAENSGMKIYYITKDEAGVNRTLVSKDITKDLGFEAGIFDSGKPKNLEKFIKGVIKNYPAENYHLDIGTHGAGVKGVIVDDNAGVVGEHSMMKIKELRDTLGLVFARVVNQIAENAKDEIKLNIISFDACLMGMYEINHDFAGKNIGYIVSSEEVIPGHGFTYNDILQYLKDKSMQEAGVAEKGKGYSEKMIDSYYEAYNGKAKACLSSIELETLKSEGVNEAIAEVFKAINAKTDAEDMSKNIDLMIEYHSALFNAVYFSDDTFIDLIDFLKKIKDNEKLLAIVTAEKIDNAISKINRTIVKNVAMGDEAWKNGVNGVAIYMPYYYRVKKDGNIHRRSFREYTYYVNGLDFATSEMGKEINTLFDTYIKTMEVLPDSSFDIEPDPVETVETASAE